MFVYEIGEEFSSWLFGTLLKNHKNYRDTRMPVGSSASQQNISNCCQKS